MGARHRTTGERAVIIGSGISGLLTARVLSDHFARVTIIERDALPVDPVIRKKTPQAPHSHVLGGLGYRMFTELFPDLDGDLAAAGAPAFDYLGDCRMHIGGWIPCFDSGIRSRLCTRMLLELNMRRYVTRLPNVEIRGQERVDAMTISPDQDRITGVELVHEGGARESIEADLVVDGSGLGSRMPRLVEELGYGTPEEAGIDLVGATVTRVFRPAPGVPQDWVAVFIRGHDGNHRTGALTRIEGGVWRVSLAGWSGVYPPKTEAGFLDFAAQLADPTIHDYLAPAEPLSPVYYFGRSLSRWVRFDKLDGLPDGTVVIGDAVFHANPEHAQGMTFCAMAAVTLGEMLGSSDQKVRDRRGFTLLYQRRLAELYRPYWLWNAAAELSLPNVSDNARLDAADKERVASYGKIRAVAPRDPELLAAAMRVTQAERRPDDLLRPDILARVRELGGEAASQPD